MVYGREISKIILIVLVAAYEPTGYEIMKMLREGSEGLVKAGPGTVYPALFILERQGYIRKVKEDNKKARYTITEKGLRYLKENLPRFKKVITTTLQIIEKIEEKYKI